MGEEFIEPILKSVNESGGGWPVLVLVLFWFSALIAIVYVARYVISRQQRLNEQRIQDRKMEFEAQLERERNDKEVQLERERQNTANYQGTTAMMVDAFNKNSSAMAEFTSVLRPMSETLTRLDHHIQQQTFQQHTPRSKPRGEE